MTAVPPCRARLLQGDHASAELCGSQWEGLPPTLPRYGQTAVSEPLAPLKLNGATCSQTTRQALSAAGQVTASHMHAHMVGEPAIWVQELAACKQGGGYRPAHICSDDECHTTQDVSFDVLQG